MIVAFQFRIDITLFLCLFVSFCWGQELTLSNDSRLYVAPSGMAVVAKGGITLKDTAGLVNSSEVVLPTEGFLSWLHLLLT